jgi:hypothetical protein
MEILRPTTPAAAAAAAAAVYTCISYHWELFRAFCTLRCKNAKNDVQCYGAWWFKCNSAVNRPNWTFGPSKTHTQRPTQLRATPALGAVIIIAAAVRQPTG